MKYIRLWAGAFPSVAESGSSAAPLRACVEITSELRMSPRNFRTPDVVEFGMSLSSWRRHSCLLGRDSGLLMSPGILEPPRNQTEPPLRRTNLATDEHRYEQSLFFVLSVFICVYPWPIMSLPGLEEITLTPGHQEVWRWGRRTANSTTSGVLGLIGRQGDSQDRRFRAEVQSGVGLVAVPNA